MYLIWKLGRGTMNTDVSISTCFDYSIPLEEQLQYVAKAGFKYVSLGSNLKHSRLLNSGRTQEIVNALESNGLEVDTIHFSQALNTNYWQPLMKCTMKASKELNCNVIVAHCSSFMGKETQDKTNKQILRKSIIELEKLCKECNIKVALENLCPGTATDVLEEMLYLSNPNYIGFCYDSSHDQVDGPRPMTLLEKWKHRLIAIHISDRIKPFNDHVTIGEGFIDFDEMASILKNADIHFPLLIEMMKTYSCYKDTDDFLQQAYQGAIELYYKIKD